MNQNKKQSTPRPEGEPRITVRPGNFIVPGTSAAEGKGGSTKQAPKQGAPASAQKQEGNAGHSRHHRHKRRGGDRRDRPKEGGKELQQPAREAQKPQEASKAPAVSKQQAGGQSGGRRNRRNDRHHSGNEQRERTQGTPRAEAAPTISGQLQKELDSQLSFATSLFSTPSREAVKKEESAADSKEFEVDIATAAYLIEDIPTGFPAPNGKTVEVVGVRFRQSGKVYFFAPAGLRFKIGEAAIVDTARGAEFGEIVMLNRKMAEKDIVQPLRAVLRRATEEDIAHNNANRAKEAEALRLCADKIAAHKLDMKLVDAQYTFDNSKLLFYFTSEGRVDFRELVRDLASVFRTRIELRQIGIRDEARLIGGLGLCGRPFCCTTFLSDFGQVSVKMAKEQGLAINTSKTSGCCGRLICCLRYEQESYAAEAALTPSKNTRVKTPDGTGTVVDSTPLAGTVKVRLDNSEAEEPPKVYHRDSVEIVVPRTPPKDGTN